MHWISQKKEHLEMLFGDMELFAAQNGFRLIWTPPYHPEFQPIELVWAEVKSCVRACFHIDRGIKHLLHDVRVGFEGGKCALVDHVCKDLTTVAIRKKIRRSFRFAHQWGVQFYGEDFDFLTFYQTDDSFDINQIHIGRGDEVLDIDFHDALVLDMDPQWDGTVL